MQNHTTHRSLAIAVILTVAAARALAHEEGAPFSGAITDPPILHHAHIENEQRLNFFALRDFEGSPGKKTAYESELEMAFATSNYRYGAEIFVPFSNLPSQSGRGTDTGIGDIELRPFKYSLLMKPDFVVSTATGLGLPTGSESKGLGNGQTMLTQYLFADKAIGNWAVTLNLGVGTTLSGESDTIFEHGIGFSYSFIRGVSFGDLAPSRPNQKWVFTPSIEYVGEYGLRGVSRDNDNGVIIPALTCWHVASGWQFRFGVQLPITRDKEAEQIFMFQVGNHLNWASLLGLKRKPELDH